MKKLEETSATEKKKEALPPGVTEDMVNGWKEKYGSNKIKKIALYKDGDIDPFEVIVRKPDRKITTEYWKYMDKQIDRAMSILVTNCCLHDADKIKADDELLFTAGTQIAELLPIGRGEIKNC